MAKKKSLIDQLREKSNVELLDVPVLPTKDDAYSDLGASSIIPMEYDKYAKYLSNYGRDVISDSPESWDEKRALRQSGFEKFYSTVGQGLGTFGTALGSAIGVLGGIPYAAIHAWEDGDQSQLDDVIANPVVKGFSQLDKYIKEDLLPTYYTQEQQNSLMSAATGTDLVNGVGFLLSNLVPGAIVNKGVGLLSNAITKNKLGLLTTELQAAVDAEVITAAEAGKYSSLIKGLEKTGDVTSAILGRVGETAIEANDAEEKIIQNLTQKREEARQKLMLGETPDNLEDASLTDDQIKQLAKEQRNNVFGANMFLAVSDFMQAGRWFGKNPLLKDIQKQGLKYAVAERSKGELLKDFFKEALQEAGEEGFQFLAQKGAENAAQNKDFLGEFNKATNDLFTTVEGQKSMLLGALLGGGAGAAFNALNGKERKNRLNALVDNLNANPDIKDRYIINAEGKRVFNPEFASGTEKFVMYEAAKQAAKETNDQDSYDLAEKLQFADLVASRHQAGRLNDLIDEIKSIGNMNPKEVEDFFGEAPLNPITNEKMTPSEIASQKIEEARSIAKAIDGLSQMKEFANLSAAGKSHIANRLVHQDVLKKQYVDLNKKISEIKPSDIQVSTPSIVPIETALNENPTEGKNPLEMNPEVISQPVETKETYSALDQAKLDELNRKKQIIEKQYAAINEELKGYAKDPKAADIVAEDEEVAQVDKEVEKQQRQIIIKNKLAKYENDIKEKAAADNLIPEEYKLVSEYNEPLFIAKNAKGETILRNGAGKDVTYRLAKEDFKISHISENSEEEEIEDDSFVQDEEPWKFQKTTIFTSAGRSSTAPNTFNSNGDRENLGLSLGRKLFYKTIKDAKGKLSLKLEVAPEGMYPELFTDDNGNPINKEDINPKTLPVIIGYLYKATKNNEAEPVIENGIRAYNVIHHHDSNHQFASTNPEKDLELLKTLRNTVISREGSGLESYVDITEISNGFLNITESARPLKDVLGLKSVKANGPTIKTSVISPNTRKPVIVENGKEVANVKWSGRPYLRVKTGTNETGNPIYTYEELGTRNLNDFEIESIIMPLIINYINGNDTVTVDGKEMQILSYNPNTPSILDMFLYFGKTGNHANSIFFGKGNQTRVLSFGANEDGTKLVMNKSNIDQLTAPLLEFLKTKKRAISRKYTEGSINISQNLFIPVFTGSGAVLRELSYLDLISGANSTFEPALTTRLSEKDILLNQYAVFDPVIKGKANTTISLKTRQSQRPVKKTDEDTDTEEFQISLTEPMNTIEFRLLNDKDKTEYYKNMLKNPKYGKKYIIGTPVPEFADLLAKHDDVIFEASKTDSSYPSLLEFAKENLTEEEYKKFLGYTRTSSAQFGAKPKGQSKSAQFLDKTDTNLKIGSKVLKLVSVDGKEVEKEFIVYGIDGTKVYLRSAVNADLDTAIDNELKVTGAYPVVIRKNNNVSVRFIVTSESRIINFQGKNVYENKTKSKKGSFGKILRKKIVDEAKEQIAKRKEDAKKIYVEQEVVDLTSPFKTSADFDAKLPDNLADVDPEINELVEDIESTEKETEKFDDVKTKKLDIEKRRKEEFKGNIVEEVKVYSITVRGKQYEIYEEKYDKNSPKYFLYVKKDNGEISSISRDDEKILKEEGKNKQFLRDETSEWIDTELQSEINDRYDIELAKELYKEMKAGKMVAEMTPAEQIVADKYITEELRKSVDNELTVSEKPKSEEGPKKPESIDWEDDDIDARQNVGLPYKVGDVKSASNWLQKTLGVTPSIAEGIIRVAGFDNGLFGYFYQGAITLSDILEEGTEYHEAYHLVSRMYLTPSQRQSLYNEVRKREGKELTDKQAEEILAEDFREYVMTDGKIVYPEVQKNIFQKLLDFVKWIFNAKPLTVNELFSKINQGYYNQKKYIQKLNNGSKDMFGRDSAHIFSPSETFKTDETLNSLFSVYLKINKLRLYNLDVKESITNFEAYAKEQLALTNSIFNVDPKYFLKRFKENLLAQPEFDFEIELPEEERGKNSAENYSESNRLSAFAKINDNVNVMFSIISDISSKKDPDTNQFKIIPKSEVKAYLADILHDVFSYKEMVDILTEKANQVSANNSKFEKRNAGIAKQILYQLKGTDTGPNATAFRIQFQEGLSLVKQAMLTTIHYAPSKTSTGNAVVVNSMESVIEKRIKDSWANSVMRSNYITNVQGLRFISEANWNVLLAQDPKTFFESLGIEFRGQITPSVMGLVALLKNHLNRLPQKRITLLKDNKETEVIVRTPVLFGVDSYYDDYLSTLTDAFEKKSLFTAIAGIKDAVKNLVALEIPYYNSTIEAQSRNTEGETVYAYSKPSFIFQQIKRIKDGIAKYNTANNSVLWEAIEDNAIDVSLIDGGKYNGQGEEGIHISQFTEEDMLYNKIINLFNDPNRGTIQFLQMADKKSVPGLTVNKNTNRNLIYNPSEITITPDGTVSLSSANRAVKRLWDMYKNYQELDKNTDVLDNIKTYGKAVDVFEEVNNNKPYENIDQFAKGISLIITQGMLDTLPFANNFIGKKGDNVKSIIPDNILSLSDKVDVIDQVKQIVAAVVTTEFVNNLDQMNVFFGNAIFYKALFKRTPEVRANGRVPSVDDFVNETILEFRKQYNITEEQKNAMPIDGTYKSIIGKDKMVSSKYAEEYKEILGKDAYGNDQINPVDGQGAATFYFYLEYGIRTGQLYGKEFEKAVEAELKGLSSNYPFPPLKLVHYGNQLGLGNEFVPVFYKFSVYPLIPSMIKGRNLEKINKKLLDSGAGLYIFDSGVKDGNPKVLDDASTDTVDPASMHHLNLQDLKIQVDINPKYDKFSLLLGTQIRKLINQNSADAGKDVKNKELVDSYEQTVKDLIQLEAEMLADKLGESLSSLQSGIISHESWSKLIDMFKESAIEREESDNLIIGLDYLKQEDLTIDVLPNRNKVQNLMNAFINNKILKQNMRGRAYVQCSSVGFEYTTEKDLEAAVKKGIILKDSEFYRSHFVDGKFDSTDARLGFVHVKEDKIVTAEILLPYYFKEAGFDINNIDSKLLEALGYRIPTQGLNSMLAFKVVGFLPKSTDQLVAVPYEITMQSGSDFDVDKLNTFLRNYILKNKELKPISEEKEITYSKLLTDLIEKRDRLVLEDYTLEELEDLDIETLEDIDTEKLDKKIEELKEKEIKKFKKLKLQEQLFDIMYQKLTDPSMMFDYINPNSAENLENQAKEINQIQTAPYKKTTEYKGYRQFLTGTNIKVAKNFWSAKAGVGQAASQSVFTALTQLYPIVQEKYSNRIFVPKDQLILEDNKIVFGRINNADGKSIIDLIANQHVSANVDAASKPFVFQLNANLLTNDVHYYLIAATVPDTWVNKFLTQPIIIDYVNEMEQNKGIVAKRRRALFNIYNNEQAVFEKLKSKYGRPYDVSEYFTSQVDDDGLRIPTASDENRRYTEEELVEFIKNPTKYGQQQINILDDFLFYKQFASQRRDQIAAIKFDTEGSGKNLPESKIIDFRYYKVVQRKFFSGLNELIQNSFLSAFKTNVLDLTLQMYANSTIVERTPNAQSALYIVMEKLFNSKQLKPENMYKIYGLITNTILQNNLVTANQEQWWNVNMLSSNSIALQVSKMINSKELEDNYLFQNLLTIDYALTPNEPDIIRIDNTVRIDNDLQKVIYESFKSFGNLNPEMYRKIIEASLFQTGVIESPVSFYKYIPVDDFVNVVGPLVKRQSKIDTLTYLSQIYQNLPTLKGVVKSVRYNDIIGEKSGLPDSIEVPNEFNYDVDYLLKKSKNKIGLYERKGENKDTFVFEKIPIKSNLKFYNTLINSNINVTNLDEDITDIDYVEVTPEVKGLPAVKSTIGPETKINIYASTGENADLSNFAVRPFTPIINGVELGKFNTVEGAFHAMKILEYSKNKESQIDQYKILKTTTGANARSIGRSITGLDTKAWDANSSKIMKDLMKQSFEQNPTALQKLLATGNATLTHKYNNVEQDKGRFSKLLMEVRDELNSTEPTTTASYAISKIKLSDGKEYNVKDITEEMLINLKYSQEDAMEIINKFCKQL